MPRCFLKCRANKGACDQNPRIAHRFVLTRHPLPLAVLARNRSACTAQLRHCTLPEGPSVARSPELGLDAYWWRLPNETVCRSVTALRIDDRLHSREGHRRATLNLHVGSWTRKVSRETRLLPRLSMCYDYGLHRFERELLDHSKVPVSVTSTIPLISPLFVDIMPTR